MVTIALITYNRLAFLKQSLAAILNQTYRDFELVIIDNGSTLETKEYLSSISDTRISIISFDQNDINNYNYPLKMETKRYLLIAHDDDIYENNLLDELLHSITKYDFEAVSCNASIIDNNSKILSNNLLNLEEESILLTRNYIKHYLKREIPLTPAVLIDKNFFQSNGIQLELNISRAADQIMWSTVLEKGGKICIINKDLFRYRIHNNQDSQKYMGIMEYELYSYWLINSVTDKGSRLELIKRVIKLFFELNNIENISPYSQKVFCKIKYEHGLGIVNYFLIKAIGYFGFSRLTAKFYSLIKPI